MSAGAWCLDCGHYHPTGSGCRTHVSGDLGLLMCPCEKTPAAQALAAALRREAHELECQVAAVRGGGLPVLREAEKLRARADRLDGSGS